MMKHIADIEQTPMRSPEETDGPPTTDLLVLGGSDKAVALVVAEDAFGPNYVTDSGLDQALGEQVDAPVILEGEQRERLEEALRIHAERGGLLQPVAKGLQDELAIRRERNAHLRPSPFSIAAEYSTEPMHIGDGEIVLSTTEQFITAYRLVREFFGERHDLVQDRRGTFHGEYTFADVFYALGNVDALPPRGFRFNGDDARTILEALQKAAERHETAQAISGFLPGLEAVNDQMNPQDKAATYMLREAIQADRSSIQLSSSEMAA